MQNSQLNSELGRSASQNPYLLTQKKVQNLINLLNEDVPSIEYYINKISSKQLIHQKIIETLQDSLKTFKSQIGTMNYQEIFNITMQNEEQPKKPLIQEDNIIYEYILTDGGRQAKKPLGRSRQISKLEIVKAPGSNKSQKDIEELERQLRLLQEQEDENKKQAQSNKDMFNALVALRKQVNQQKLDLDNNKGQSVPEQKQKMTTIVDNIDRGLDRISKMNLPQEEIKEPVIKEPEVKQQSPPQAKLESAPKQVVKSSHLAQPLTTSQYSRPNRQRARANKPSIQKEEMPDSEEEIKDPEEELQPPVITQSRSLKNPNIEKPHQINEFQERLKTLDVKVKDTMKEVGSFNYGPEPEDISRTRKWNPSMRTKNGIYQGEVIPDTEIMEGMGTFIWKNDALYEGWWKNKKRHGKGREIFPDGTVINCQFQDGKKNGYGKAWYHNGNIYEGNWVDGQFCGQGTYILSNGSKYVGSFLNNLANGKGINYYSNGDKFEGQYKDNEAHGEGIYTLKNGKQEKRKFNMGKPVRLATQI